MSLDEYANQGLKAIPATKFHGFFHNFTLSDEDQLIRPGTDVIPSGYAPPNRVVSHRPGIRLSGARTQISPFSGPKRIGGVLVGIAVATASKAGGMPER